MFRREAEHLLLAGKAGFNWRIHREIKTKLSPANGYHARLCWQTTSASYCSIAINAML